MEDEAQVGLVYTHAKGRGRDQQVDPPGEHAGVVVQAGVGSTMTANARLDVGDVRRYRRRPGMSNLLSRQALDLYVDSYGEAGIRRRNGLLKELFDGATGFAKWCNEQGGVAGLPVEVVDMDGKLFEIEAAMAKACTGVFAMVGGGYAQDNLIFTGKDGSDFHKCGMVAVPGFAVSTEFAEASDQIQAIPNPPHLKGVSHFEGLKSVYPDKVAKYGVAFGDLPSIVQNKDQTVATVKSVEGYGDPVEISYDPINQDFAVTAQQVSRTYDGTTAASGSA